MAEPDGHDPIRLGRGRTRPPRHCPRGRGRGQGIRSGVMTEQMMRLRHVGVRRPGRHHPGGQQAGQGEADGPGTWPARSAGGTAVRWRPASRTRWRCPEPSRAAGWRSAARWPAGDQQGRARVRQQGRADPLHHPGRRSAARLHGQTSGDACRDEHDQADPVQPGPAAGVGETAAQQQEPAEGDRVGADQPLQRRGGDVQVTLDGGQRLGLAVTQPTPFRLVPASSPPAGRLGSGYLDMARTMAGPFMTGEANPPQRPARTPLPAAAPAGRRGHPGLTLA